jgi:putative intracellular protease/amidase
MAQKTVGVLLFPEFELLDVFGPLEAFGQAKDWFRVVTVAERPGPVASAQGPRAMADHGFTDCPAIDILLVPGGMGTRREVLRRRRRYAPAPRCSPGRACSTDAARRPTSAPSAGWPSKGRR